MNYKPKSNIVVVQVDRKNDKVKFDSGVELYIDTTYQEGRHVERSGKVVAVSEDIQYPKNIEWDTDIEVQEEDWVVFDHLIGIQCDKIDNLYLLPYSALIALKNSSGIKPLNGYLLSKKLSYELKTNIEVPHIPTYNDRFEIIYAGKPNRSYIQKNWYDDPHIKQGMKVITRFANYPVAEYDQHLHVLDDEYHYFQRKEVILYE